MRKLSVEKLNTLSHGCEGLELDLPLRDTGACVLSFMGFWLFETEKIPTWKLWHGCLLSIVGIESRIQ